MPLVPEFLVLSGDFVDCVYPQVLTQRTQVWCQVTGVLAYSALFKAELSAGSDYDQRFT